MALETNVEALLARIDERTKHTDTRITDLTTQINGLDTKMDSHFVTKTEFDPVKRVVYGLVTFLLLAFAAAIVALVFKG